MPSTDWFLQASGLGLLGYLIVWLTKTGAPMLFIHLEGIQEAITDNTARLEQLEDSHKELISHCRTCQNTSCPFRS